MKNYTRHVIAFFIIPVVLLVALPACNKNNNTDLADKYEGTYTNSDTYPYAGYNLTQTTYFTVTRASENHINLQITRTASSGFVPWVHSCYFNVALDAQSHFTVSGSDSCASAQWGAPATASGGGSFTSNSISMDWTLTFSGGGPPSQHQNIIALK